jgi:hypothetical protein
MNFTNKKVEIISGEHKGKSGIIQHSEEDCACFINNHEASECDCDEISDVSFDGDNKTYKIVHSDMKFL